VNVSNEILQTLPAKFQGRSETRMPIVQPRFSGHLPTYRDLSRLKKIIDFASKRYVLCERPLAENSHTVIKVKGAGSD
jgi:hypothetical protein